jgi:uncharacterized YccA/Bax inhibitor family protein
VRRMRRWAAGLIFGGAAVIVATGWVDDGRIRIVGALTLLAGLFLGAISFGNK